MTDLTPEQKAAVVSRFTEGDRDYTVLGGEMLEVDMVPVVVLDIIREALRGVVEAGEKFRHAVTEGDIKANGFVSYMLLGEAIEATKVALRACGKGAE